VAAGTALQTFIEKVGQVQKTKMKLVLLHNGGYKCAYNDLVSQRLYEKKMKVMKCNGFNDIVLKESLQDPPLCRQQHY
jgi:hypothetical protein